MIMQVQHLCHALIIHTGDYIMFKKLTTKLFGLNKTDVAAITRYVEMEYRPAERASALAILLREARG
jgi:hypothetical protein